MAKIELDKYYTPDDLAPAFKALNLTRETIRDYKLNLLTK